MGAVFRLLKRLFISTGLYARTVNAVGQKVGFPPGHFYSPLPDIVQIRKKEGKLWGEPPDSVAGIDLNVGEQLSLLKKFHGYYQDLPFSDQKKHDLRYYFANDFYSYSDAIFLYSMIRHLKPKRIVEIGSGFSSCLILDTNELFFQERIACTFIDPYPERLFSLIKNEDKENITIIRKELQDVNLGIFRELGKDDILFVDSTHVAKIGSDVNLIFFDILPVLNQGVYIHFHDIFYPFQYPKEWIYEGRAWNEAYILRAFLQYNTHFRITFFSNFLFHFYPDLILKRMPLCRRNPGAQLWIRREGGAG